MIPEKFRLGIRLFNESRFFEAHEVLEDVWRETKGPKRKLLQGLIQLAVALHHHSQGNTRGAASLMPKAAQNLASGSEDSCGLDLHYLRAQIRIWSEAIELGRPVPGYPLLKIDSTRMVESDFPVNTSAKMNSQSPAMNKITQVPTLDLRRQYAQIRDEVSAALQRVCESQYFILGDEVASFEREVAGFLGVQRAAGCASGTDAIWLALAAVGVQPGDSVITTPFSFLATASTIARLGARPVFVDIDPETCNLDPVLVQKKIEAGTNAQLRAILPVHLYGQCSNMDEFNRIAQEHGLAIIEDAAQAFGAAWNGRYAGSLGTVAAFSFYPTKNLSAYGDGGCVTTSIPELADRVFVLRNHGSRQRYYHDETGWNSRLDAMQAAILRVKLKYIESWNVARRRCAEVYGQLLVQSGMVSNPGSGGGIAPHAPVQSFKTLPQAHHVFHQYVIRAHRRDELRAFLSENGIGTEIYYPLPLHLQKCFSYLGYREGDLPESERAAREVLALPMFPELTHEEQKYVVEKIAAFYS